MTSFELDTVGEKLWPKAVLILTLLANIGPKSVGHGHLGRARDLFSFMFKLLKIFWSV
jgi:hypothetical protein